MKCACRKNPLRVWRFGTLGLVIMVIGHLLGCRTSGANGLNSSDAMDPSRGYHCVFKAHPDSNEQLDVLAVLGSSTALQAIRVRHDTSEETSGQSVEVPAPPQVDAPVITQQGQRKIRSYTKGLLKVDFGSLTCIDLSVSPSPGEKANFFCIAKNSNSNGGRDALWLTNLSKRRYGSALCGYPTVCDGPK